MCQFAVGTPTDKNTFTILTISLIYFTLYYMEKKLYINIYKNTNNNNYNKKKMIKIKIKWAKATLKLYLQNG